MQEKEGFSIQQRLFVYEKSFWVAFLATLVASLAGKYLATLPVLSIIGAMVLSLLIGMLYQWHAGLVIAAEQGIKVISNKFLRIGIILLGFRLNIALLAASGVKTILLASLVVTMTILLVLALARYFRVEEELALLTACGCGICGAAAIMGISPQVKAKTDDAVLAVAVVCILGTIFTVGLVILKPFLPLSDVQFGVLSGAALHEIAHALAAAGAGGTVALDAAIITKLSRVLLLVPVTFIVGYFYQRKATPDHASPSGKQPLPIPWFMVGFLATSAIGSFAPLPERLVGQFVSLAYIFLGMAMAALGMSVNFKVIVLRGGRVFLAALLGTLVLFAVAFIVIKLFW